MSFPPKGDNSNGPDLKYIGIDEHKEAIMIAVQNTGGHLVMESMVETTC